MFAEVEVATTAADASHAYIRITGPVGRAAAPMLAAVLNSHLRVGRRFLHIDVAAAGLADDAAAVFETAADAATARGGALTLEHAGPRAAKVSDAVGGVRRTPARV